MESSEYLESNHNMGEDDTPSSLTSSQTLVFFSVFCVLLKSEAIFTFFVYWLRGLALTSGTVGIPDYDTLSHIWLLKPFFSLVIDRLEVFVSHKGRDLETGVNMPQNVPYNATVTYLFFKVSKYRVAFLIGIEYVIAISSVVLYLLHYFDCFHTYLTNLLTYSLALGLIFASSYCEGLFSTYVRSRGPKTYVRNVSLRLMLAALYGLTTLVCLLFPVMFRNNPASKFFQINSFFPMFLTFNAVFISWLVFRPTDTLYHPVSVGFSPVTYQIGNKDADEDTEEFSLEAMVALMVMMLLSIRIKNDFFNQYNSTRLDNYFFILLTQVCKFITSLLIYCFMGARGLMRVCMGVFAASLILLYPMKSYAAVLFDKMTKLGGWEVLVAGFLLSYAQQIILTYALFTSLMNTPAGYEASVLSMPTFVAHLTHLCLRQHIIDYVDLSKKQQWFFQVLGLFIFSYCFLVLLRVNKVNSWKFRTLYEKEGHEL